MLDQLVLQSTSPVTLNVTEVDPDEMLVVQSISGLTSGGVSQYMGDFASEGSYYQGRRAKNLNPVITLKLNPDYAGDVSIAKIRDILYRMFYDPIVDSDGLPCVIKDDEFPDRYFIGYTEDINTTQFSKEQTAMVSMTTTEAYLKSSAETSAADAVGWISTPIAYDGSADTGIEFTINVKVATATIFIDLNGKVMRLNSPTTYAVNDLIVVNTNKRSRKITLNGVDVMAHLASTSVWLTLDRAANTLKTYGGAGGDGKTAIMNYKFRSSWWGV